MGILLKKDSLLTKFAKKRENASIYIVVRDLLFKRFAALLIFSDFRNVYFTNLSEWERERNLVSAFTGPDNEKFVLIASKLVKEYWKTD